jgi:hypothetical protein
MGALLLGHKLYDAFKACPEELFATRDLKTDHLFYVGDPNLGEADEDRRQLRLDIG